MNIYGIGTDIVNINRIKKAIKKKTSNTFKKRIFTNFEIKTCEKRKKKQNVLQKDLLLKKLFSKLYPQKIN